MGFGKVGGWNSPSRPSEQTWAQQKKKSSQCVRANNSTESDSVCAQVLSGQSQIHPELSKATDERLELSVLPPRKPLPCPKRKHIHYASPLSSCTNGKIGTAKGGVGGGENNQTSRNKRTPNVTRVGRWVCTVNAGKDFDFRNLRFCTRVSRSARSMFRFKQNLLGSICRSSLFCLEED